MQNIGIEHDQQSDMSLHHDVLEKCIRLLTENLKIKTQEHDNKVKFQGVGRFGSRVLFAKPVTGVSFLQSIFSLSQKILTDAGIKVENKKDFYHTVLYRFHRLLDREI